MCTKNASRCIKFNADHIKIYPKCIKMRFVLYIDPPALRLTCMSDGVVRAKIQQLGQQAKFRVVLELKGLPPRTQPQAATAQASTSAESKAIGETPTPKEIARNKARETIFKATFRHAKKIYGDEPPLQPGLSGVDIPFNQGYGFQNIEGIIRLMDYGASNGGFIPLATQQRGACLFHSFRRSICCPCEFTNTHLRRMLVSFICGRAEELYVLLVTAISGNYGHIRISQREYDRLMSFQQLTDAQKTQVEEFKEPDVTLPRPPSAQEAFPEAIKKQLVANMLLQHSTAVEVLERIGVNACKEY